MESCEDAWEKLIKFHSLRVKLPESDQDSVVRETLGAIRHVGRCALCRQRFKKELCTGVYDFYRQGPEPGTSYFEMHKGLHRIISFPYIEEEHFGGTGYIGY